MALLNQIVAVENGTKSRTSRELTDLHRTTQKPALFTGIHRVYTPKDDEGDKLPSETTLVQKNVEDILDDASKAMTRLFDVVLTKEVGNTEAKADVVVDGQVLLMNVPVTYLLFLEKQLVDIHTFVGKLPTLDPAQHWSLDENSGVWKADVVETTRTKKVPRNHVKAEATEKHPAQVEVYTEDVIVGTWAKVDTSGAIPNTRRAQLLERVEKLQEAVKFARERANSVEVDDQRAGETVFNYLFA